MTIALIGHSGFVGTTLRRQTTFDDCFRSSDIDAVDGRRFSMAVCAAAPGQKWRANADPSADAAAIDSLIRHLDTIEADCFVLISTVDVFGSPVGVDESSPVDPASLQPYGSNRARLEQFVDSRFRRSLVVRLPGLVGPGLRKNVVYDLLHSNELHKIDSRSTFQWYPMVNLWWDIGTALEHGLDVVHLTAEPVSVGSIASLCFGMSFQNHLDRPPTRYDFRSRYAQLFGGPGSYQYAARDSFLAIRSYAQSTTATGDRKR